MATLSTGKIAPETSKNVYRGAETYVKADLFGEFTRLRASNLQGGR
jgi:hypothetical protein